MEMAWSPSFGTMPFFLRRFFMGMLLHCGDEKIRLSNILKYLKYKLQFRTENPDYFDADGLLCFVGPQGSGKTLSAVNYVYNLLKLYPGSKLVTNLFLTDYPIVDFQEFKNRHAYLLEELRTNEIPEAIMESILSRFYLEENRVFPFVDNDDFIRYSNQDRGVIFLVDEIQLYLNSLESKNINMDVMTQISQQRKQRKHIIATSQVFGRMAKPLREQFSNVVVCKNYLGFLQRNSLIDRDSLDTESSTATNLSGKVRRNFIWLHSPDMYKRYDTYYVIEKGKFIAGEQQNKGVYENANGTQLPDHC
jgi:Zonular occludens toxin (Zot).